MTLPLIDIHHPSRRLIASLTENYTGYTEYTAETFCKLKCKIKHIYRDTLKLNFSPWPNWTRPDPPFPANFLTRSDPRVGSSVMQLWYKCLLGWPGTGLSVWAVYTGRSSCWTTASSFRQPPSTVVPRFQLDTYGRRTFAVAGPTTWNLFRNN